ISPNSSRHYGLIIAAIYRNRASRPWAPFRWHLAYRAFLLGHINDREQIGGEPRALGLQDIEHRGDRDCGLIALPPFSRICRPACAASGWLKPGGAQLEHEASAAKTYEEAGWPS